MGKFNAENIRNVALIGHGGEGKTSLAEAMLFNGKIIDRMGRIADGNTVTDYDELEISKKSSISLAVAAMEWQNVKINIIDVPGFYDFEAEMIQALRAADGAVIVASACGEVTVGAEKAISYCTSHKIPMILFINGIDKENSRYQATVDAFKAKYPNKFAQVQMPIMNGSKMVGYVSVLKSIAYLFGEQGRRQIEIPDDLKEAHKTAYENLTEVAAESDDDLMEKYFAESTLTKEEILRGIRKGVLAETAIPIKAGSAYGNKGVISLLDEIIVSMPSPKDRNGVVAIDSKGEIREASCDEKNPLALQVFKTVVDPFVGKLSYIRVFGGTLKTGTTVYNMNSEKQERINQIYILKGKKQEAVNELTAGDIGAVNKLSFTGTGDTLTDENNKIRFEEIAFPKPVLSLAVYAEKQGEEDKIFAGLNKLAEEDLSFTVEKNKETNEMIITGQGETHLDVIVKKLKAKFGVNTLLVKPKIAYRETIKKTVTAEGKHKKQSGGHGQYGHCKIRFEPYSEGDFSFGDEVVGGAVPKSYIPAVEKGIRECIVKGVLAGYPVVNLRAVLFDGSYHDVDSSEMAFKLAAAIAYKEGLKNAEPTILEPILEVKIRVPENYLGDILGDLNKRRGRILGIDADGDNQIINAEAPEAEMFKYATDLRSMTQGRGKFVQKFARYEEAPYATQEKIIKENNLLSE